MVNKAMEQGCDMDVIGLMSGTSLDGLDICFTRFSWNNGVWQYQILKAESMSYPADIKEKLATAQRMDALSFARFHSDYGLYLGACVRSFMEKHQVRPHIIASHGHSIFHQPRHRFTFQIGSGAGVAAESGVDTVCDFRTTDVALYGQGAPLVPIGDRHLFGNYDYCLNLGGFSNISSEQNGVRSAYDISPVNYVLNHYTRSIGKEYDHDGEMAQSGKVCTALLEALNGLDFYTQTGPKSLGREWVEETVIPLIDAYGLDINDKLSTFCEHVAWQISRHIKGGKVLATGGGALNKYLMERMSALAPQCSYHIPDSLTINFKEALIFGFLGVLYVRNMPNCLSSVTGATYDCIGGALYKSGRRW
ncbi:MAG: anhydro-N-acetylmuramic acid kinase [Bacteroidales bacterium]|nr:anhydro-N-acetylmuramic acid kinase [Bacteroidales bacterium]MCL2738249.1 anhydro-N-acetylmuramic acid kinase [Bacteroidales bacterium]